MSTLSTCNVKDDADSTSTCKRNLYVSTLYFIDKKSETERVCDNFNEIENLNAIYLTRLINEL